MQLGHGPKTRALAAQGWGYQRKHAPSQEPLPSKPRGQTEVLGSEP